MFNPVSLLAFQFVLSIQLAVTFFLGFLLSADFLGNFISNSCVAFLLLFLFLTVLFEAGFLVCLGSLLF